MYLVPCGCCNVPSAPLPLRGSTRWDGLIRLCLSLRGDIWNQTADRPFGFESSCWNRCLLAQHALSLNVQLKERTCCITSVTCQPLIWLPNPHPNRSKIRLLILPRMSLIILIFPTIKLIGQMPTPSDRRTAKKACHVLKFVPRLKCTPVSQERGCAPCSGINSGKA